MGRTSSKAAPPLDLKLLQTFLVAARLGNFTRAAEELALTQPGVSTQLRRLERAAGVALFESAGHGVQLTAAGEELAREAARSWATPSACRTASCRTRTAGRAGCAWARARRRATTCCPSSSRASESRRRASRSRQRVRPHIVMELSGADAIKNMVEAGLGVAALSRLAVERSSDLVALSASGAGMKRRLSLIHHPAKSTCPLVKKFRDLARALAA